MAFLNKKAQAELAAMMEHGGSLLPAAVVEWARDKETSALHACFEWDDSRAAEKYRIEQARGFIRIVVTVPDQTTAPVRLFVSMLEDRGMVGYRRLDDVLADSAARQKLVDQFLRELRAYELRYRRIAELAPIFAAADKVRNRRGKRAA